MKIFIIGSNSFMGASLINFIQTYNRNKFKIFGCSRSKEKSKYFNIYKKNKHNIFHFFKIDLNKDIKKLIIKLEKIKPEIIFNFAAQSIVEYSWIKPEHWFDTNLKSNIKLLEYLKDVKYLKKYFQSSTPEVYGSVNKKILENFFYNPSTPYATSKASIDMLLKNYHDNYKFPVIFTRVSNIYGPGQQVFKIIPKTILSLMEKKKIPLHGKGLSKRSFIYSDDVSRAMLKLIHKSKNGQIYHITNEKMYTIKEVVETICKIMNKSFEKSVKLEKERPGKDFIYNLSSKKIKKEVKWKSEVSLSKGVTNTINWLRNDYGYFKNIDLNYLHIK